MLADLAYYLGILIVILTHAWMIWTNSMPQSAVRPHAYINLAAAFLIAFSWMSVKGMIDY